jgi:Uncharacterized protein conserved in bacteria (DUF2065)
MAGKPAAPRLPRSKHPNLAQAMDVFLTALALVLVIEGLLPFFSPKSWKRSEQILRIIHGGVT